jgi:4-carboxymuconolactone decarboxylase
MDEKTIRSRYVELFGVVPDSWRLRQDIARQAGRETALDAIENLRETLIHGNPLDRKVQQLVHFGMLLVRSEAAAAELHARAALVAGATVAELHGVLETAAIVAGMPAFSLGVQAVTRAMAIPAHSLDTEKNNGLTG